MREFALVKFLGTFRATLLSAAIEHFSSSKNTGAYELSSVELEGKRPLSVVMFPP